MERVLADTRIEDCDEALALLRDLASADSADLREVARLSIDDVLDRRNELVAGLAMDYSGVQRHPVDCEDGA